MSVMEKYSEWYLFGGAYLEEHRTVECLVCGASVLDRGLHCSWHNEQYTTLVEHIQGLINNGI